MRSVFTRQNCLLYGLLFVACFSTTILLVDAADNKPHGTGMFGGTTISDIKRDYGISDYCSNYIPYHNQAVDCQILVEVKALNAKIEQLENELAIHHDSWAKHEQQQKMAGITP